jgi:antitoxin VapB
MAGKPYRSKARVLQSHRSQTVQLPDDVAFPPNVKDVTIMRDGKQRILVPLDASWDDFFAGSDIELAERDQPAPQTREAF